MKSLPEYEAAHVCMAQLGGVRVQTEVPMPKRLNEATKLALRAFTHAQKGY